MQPSLLKIKKIEFTKIHLEALSEEGSSEQSVESCEVGTFRNDSGVWLVSLTIYFGADRQKAKYRGEINLFGEFIVCSETIKEETAENLVNVNSPAILYSTAREMILNITSRSKNGAWMLPSVTFIDRKKIRASAEDIKVDEGSKIKADVTHE